MSLRLFNPATDSDDINRMADVNFPEECFYASSFSKALSDGYPVWVYENTSKVEGYLVSSVSKGTPYIYSVSTNPLHRGKGIATVLIKEFEKYYTDQGYQKAWLQTRVENPAQKLYFDLGYRVTSVEPNIYGIGSHGLVMRKKLIP